MKNYSHLINFIQSPLLIEEAAFRMMLAAQDVSAALPSPQAAFGGNQNSNNVITILSGVAVIPVLGILPYRAPSGWSYLFGSTTYQEIGENFRYALGKSDISAIVLDVASPGGTSAGLFNLVDEIYLARSVKPIYAMINESALAGAYMIASAAEKVFLPRLGSAGSIGVMAIHIDASAAEAEAGLKYTEIYAGAHKIDGTPHAPLTDSARTVYQKRVDQTYDLFIQTVARNRGLKPVDIRAQQAAIYTGKNAVTAGLADAVLSWDEAWKRVVGSKTNQRGVALAEASKETAVQALATPRIGGTSADGVNPLMVDAKKRAAVHEARK